MDDIFVYYAKLPKSINEAVLPCLGGYTVYINERLDDNQRIKAYNHALAHINGGDFEKINVQEIEGEAHTT